MNLFEGEGGRLLRNDEGILPVDEQVGVEDLVGSMGKYATEDEDERVPEVSVFLLVLYDIEIILILGLVLLFFGWLFRNYMFLVTNFFLRGNQAIVANSKGDVAQDVEGKADSNADDDSVGVDLIVDIFGEENHHCHNFEVANDDSHGPH